CFPDAKMTFENASPTLFQGSFSPLNYSSTETRHLPLTNAASQKLPIKLALA
ncbi:hypothetical protein RUM43_010597, partial [Polyplax serrata]